MSKIYALSGLLFLWVLSLPKQSLASHLVGAEIGWKYLGADTFLGTVIIERDCNGVPMPDQPFTIEPCGSATGVYVNTLKTGGLDITPVCKNFCTRCSESGCSFPFGFENYVFSAKINLKAIDSNCCEFKIVWQACCRNGAITTCPTPGENYYLEATMNPCIRPGDNSPVFINPPLMIAEVNQCLSYTFAASDSDVDANGFRDSLVYSLDTPYQAKNSSVDFSPGYAFNHPILYYGSSPNDPWYPDCKGFHLDPTTGDLMFKAIKQDITQVVVRVEEWGKDASGKPYKKGETRRDVTFFTMPSTGDAVPSLTGFNGSNNFVENFCVGQKQCFTIYSTDADTNKIVKLSSSMPLGLSTATLSVDTSTKTPSAIFCWQPDSSQAGRSYQFVLNAADNNCPLVGKYARTYTINVFASPQAKAAATNLGCGNVVFRVVPQGKGQVLSYNWTGGDGLSGSDTVIRHHYKKAGLYRWTVLYGNVSGCTDSATGLITIGPYVNISVSPRDTLVCLSKNPIVILTSTVSSGVGPYSYSWISDATTLPDKTNVLSVPVTKDTVLIAAALDNGGHCANWDTAHIKASAGTTPVKLIPPKDTLACYGQSLTLIAHATGGDSTHYGYLWKPGGSDQSKYSFIAFQPQSQLIRLTDGCSSDSATVHINVRAPLSIQVPKDTAVCPGQAVISSVTGTGGVPANYIFTWEGSLGTGPVKKLDPVFSQNYSVVLTDGCSIPDTGLVRVVVYPKPVSKPSAFKTTIIQNQSVQFENASTGATQYLWKFGDGNTSNLDTPLHQFTDTGFFNISLTAISNQGCLDSSFLSKYIHVLPAYYFYIPDAFTPNNDSLNDCFAPKGQSIKDYTLEVFSRLGNTVYKGNSCWDGTFRGLALPDGMFIYHITVTDVYGELHSYAGRFYLLN